MDELVIQMSEDYLGGVVSKKRRLWVEKRGNKVITATARGTTLYDKRYILFIRLIDMNEIINR